MKELFYVVECKSFAAFFEPIAAFNDKGIAEQYARECKACNDGFEYRVTDLDARPPR